MTNRLKTLTTLVRDLGGPDLCRVTEGWAAFSTPEAQDAAPATALGVGPGKSLGRPVFMMNRGVVYTSMLVRVSFSGHRHSCMATVYQWAI